MQQGRIVSINISPGGVPKLPVPRAQVGKLGLEGDGHHDTQNHGGPVRAVCLYAAELIARLQSEGHSAAPGTLGENVTLEGIDFDGLNSGAVLRLGRDVLIQVTWPATPCSKIASNFADGGFSRLSGRLHPGEARLYTRVVQGGEIAMGDSVVVDDPADAEMAAH